MLREFQDEIKKLKEQLSQLGGEGIDPNMLNMKMPTGAINPGVV